MGNRTITRTPIASFTNLWHSTRLPDSPALPLRRHLHPRRHPITQPPPNIRYVEPISQRLESHLQRLQLGRNTRGRRPDIQIHRIPRHWRQLPPRTEHEFPLGCGSQYLLRGCGGACRLLTVPSASLSYLFRCGAEFGLRCRNYRTSRISIIPLFGDALILFVR